MKAIMMSIRPRHSCNILNLIKLWEIRKKFPSDYVGWVYIYCTKDKKYANLINRGGFLTGMVVARFWCDKVEEISYNYRNDFTSVYTDTLDTEDLEKQACLTRHEFAKYLKGDYGYAIHITKVEPFDKPKEIKEFLTYSHTISGIGFKGEPKEFKVLKPLTRAPQSWCYVEI